MKVLIKFTAVLVLMVFLFSCNKEDIRPKQESETCTCIDGKSGSNDDSCTDGTYEPPITDPNNDEDENKVIRKTTKS